MFNKALGVLLLAAMAGCGQVAERPSAPPGAGSSSPASGDPLPSWNDGQTKRAIIDFVRRVTSAGTDGFIPPAERIAAFDNDGTLWAEQPIYVQAAFALDRVKALAPQHPEWKQKQPFKGVLEGDRRAIAAAGERGLDEAGKRGWVVADIRQDWKVIYPFQK